MKDQTNDYLVMKLRTLASMRGANPVEVQRNVNRLWNRDAEYVADRFGPSVTLRAQYIDIPEKAPCGHFKGCECWKCY